MTEPPHITQDRTTPAIHLTPRAGGRLLDGRTWDQMPSRNGDSPCPA